MRFSGKALPRVLCLLFWALLCAQLAFAQSTTGSLLGRITDSAHAVIPGAQVTATNEKTNVGYSATSDGAGNYQVSSLPPGAYTVKVKNQGFETAAISGVLLVIDQKQLLNFELKVGSVNEVVTVSTAPTMLQTQTSETGDVIQSHEIVNLPLLGRNFYDLTALSAGVGGGSGNTNAFNFSVNGQREYANSIQVDGVEATTNRTQDITTTPSVDSVEEFKVSTSAYAAEFGRSAGGVVSIQTKSGSNQFHGSAYDFWRPNFTAAKDYSFLGQHISPSDLKQHNFGGTLGGPIKKDKTFFFASFEQMRSTNSYNYVDSTPPLGQIKVLPDGSVDLSGLKDPWTGNMIPIYDPQATFACPTCTPVQFAGNILPANRVSQAGLNTLLNFFPQPNLVGTGNGWFDNFQVHSPNTYHARSGDARVDHNFSQNDRIAAVYHYNDSDQLITAPYYGHTVIKNADATDQSNYESTGAQEVAVSETHTFSARSMNEVRFGYTHYNQNQDAPLQSGDLSTKYGMGNVAVPGFAATQGYPFVQLYEGYSTGGSSYKPYYIRDNNFQLSDTFSYQGFTRHDLKFGAEFRLLHSNPFFTTFPTGYQWYAGSYGGMSATSNWYCGAWYSGCDWNAWNFAGGSSVADLLLGVPTDVWMGLQLTNPHTQAWEMHYFAQDSFKLNQRLTLNYGLRYEYQAPYTEAGNHLSNYDPARESFLLAGKGGNSAGLMNSRWNNFGPRVGFAYQLTPKTVLRGGYGIFYSPENDGREDILARNYPFGILQGFQNNVYAGGAFQYLLDTGVPRSTAIPIPAGANSIAVSAIPQGNLLTAYTIDPKMKTGNSQLFNLALQRELGSNFTLEADYVGARSHHLAYEIGDINPKDQAGNRANANLGKIQSLTDLGWSTYNSLQVKLTKRVSHNLNFQANYTLGHNIDNGAAPFNLGMNNNYPQDPHNLNAEVASADNDSRHTFVFSGLYRLPFGKGQAFLSNSGKVTDILLGGWQLNSIVSVHSGTPVNIVRGASVDTCPGVRPNLVGDPNLSNPGSKEWFNTAAFSNQGLSGCEAGDAGRNIVRGPGYLNTDASLFKEVTVHERYKIQTRLEAFNLTNSVHLSNPDGVYSDGQKFGEISRGSGNMRILQLALKVLF